MLRHAPAHLACAVMAACLLLLGTGASCDRRAPAEPAPTAEPSPPPRLDEEPLTPFAAASAAEDTPPPGKPVEARQPYVIAALGDSLTDKRSAGGGYLDVVAEACPKTVIDNYGKGADMVNQMRRRLERDILPVASSRRYTHLVVYGGVNDLYSDQTAGRSNDRIQEDLSEIYRAARSVGMKVVAITVSPWGGFRRYFTPQRAETTRQLNQWIARLPSEGFVDQVIDSYPLLSCGDPELLCPEYARPDGLHLTPRGQEVLGQALLEGAFANCE